MKLRAAIPILAILSAAALLSACPGLDNLGEGELRVRNDDASGTIVSVYISENCDDRWGAAEATGLNIPPGGISAKFDLDVDTYDVRACFASGTCGDRFDQDVDSDDTVTVGVVDEGKPESDLLCY